MGSLPERVSELLAPFSISKENLLKIVDGMEIDFRRALTVHYSESSSAMLPTFVPSIPDGTESGQYLAMDLSGSGVRILLLSLSGNPKSRKPDVLRRRFVLTNEIMTGPGKHLFDFLAGCLARFLEEYNLKDKNLPLGFVFSYPCLLKSIKSAKLLWWTKGFTAANVVGNDVVRMLEAAIHRRGDIAVRVKAIMNDTVAQLMAAGYENGPECVMGVVIGNGCNAAYIEKTANVVKFDATAAGYSHNEIAIVTEWEEYGNKGQLDFILTPFDKEVDENSVHKGKQIIDKLTGGLYLGEVARRIMDQLCTDNLLFGGEKSDILATPEKFPSKYIAEILSDEESGHYKNTRRIIDELHVINHRSADYVTMRQICEVLSRRSACIVAAAISALLRIMSRPKVVIGLGGHMYQYHPTFHELLDNELKMLAPDNVLWELVDCLDGSGRGAALVAAVAEKLKLSKDDDDVNCSDDENVAVDGVGS